MNGAAVSRNIPQELEGNDATLAIAQTLFEPQLLRREQRQKCLHFIHHLISL
jgi:hypothetical protein